MTPDSTQGMGAPQVPILGCSCLLWAGTEKPVVLQSISGPSISEEEQGVTAEAVCASAFKMRREEDFPEVLLCYQLPLADGRWRPGSEGERRVRAWVHPLH